MKPVKVIRKDNSSYKYIQEGVHIATITPNNSVVNPSTGEIIEKFDNYFGADRFILSMLAKKSRVFIKLFSVAEPVRKEIVVIADSKMLQALKNSYMKQINNHLISLSRVREVNLIFLIVEAERKASLTLDINSANAVIVTSRNRLSILVVESLEAKQHG